MNVMEVRHIFVSPDHNYFGHHGQPAGDAPMLELAEVSCVAGQGLEGDRFFGHKEDYKGQITFFAEEVYRDLCQKLKVSDKPPSVFRRNIVTAGIDLSSLIGHEFELNGIRFLGTESCKPCYWMEQAFHPGAEDALHERGGLRAKILSSGTLKTGPATLRILSSKES